MEAIKDLIFGDPVYDRRGRVVRRNFGIKNALVIILIVYGLYSLRGKMGARVRVKSGRRKSGRRKLRGGSTSEVSYPNNMRWSSSDSSVSEVSTVSYPNEWRWLDVRQREPTRSALTDEEEWVGIILFLCLICIPIGITLLVVYFATDGTIFD